GGTSALSRVGPDRWPTGLPRRAAGPPGEPGGLPTRGAGTCHIGFHHRHRPRGGPVRGGTAGQHRGHVRTSGGAGPVAAHPAARPCGGGAGAGALFVRRYLLGVTREQFSLTTADTGLEPDL